MTPGADLWRAAGLVWLLLPGVAAAEEPTAWLTRMEQALRDLDYEGRLVYVHGHTIESLHLVHTVRDGRTRERLTSLNDAKREVVRDEEATTCIMPDLGTVSVGPRRTQRPGGLVALEAAQVADSYEVRLDGQGRVAGRSATYLSLLPRDRYRYGYRMALDEATALPLRTELVDERGVPLVQTLFVDLRVGPEVAAVAEAAAPADAERGALDKSSAPVRDARPPWSFASLPPGFRLAMATRRTLPGDGRELQHLVLTDGLASVSVYISAPGGHDLDGEAAVGPVNAFGARVGAFQATALGEVPPATLKALVGALRAQPEAGG